MDSRCEGNAKFEEALSEVFRGALAQLSGESLAEFTQFSINQLQLLVNRCKDEALDLAIESEKTQAKYVESKAKLDQMIQEQNAKCWQDE